MTDFWSVSSAPLTLPSDETLPRNPKRGLLPLHPSPLAALYPFPRVIPAGVNDPHPRDWDSLTNVLSFLHPSYNSQVNSNRLFFFGGFFLSGIVK